MKFQSPIKTHIITGFLGTGKTTTLLHLLAHKPQQQKWAVLVNEFGEVGIDGALLSQSGAAIREVPGGCICCAQGLPMQVALNQLIREQNPDVLLIEPTGLGHPANLLEQLSASQYQGVLALGATLTLVNPQALFNERYLSHDTYRQQLLLADVLVFNKTDMPGCPAKDAVFAKADGLGLTDNRLWLSQGQVPLEALNAPTRPLIQKFAKAQQPALDTVLPATLSVPSGALLSAGPSTRTACTAWAFCLRPAAVLIFASCGFCSAPATCCA